MNHISKEDIKNLENILQRADLVKFAKSAPDVELAKMDRNTIDVEIDHVKEALPEPTEEEKLLDEKYREEQERKKKRKKVWLTVAISVFLVIKVKQIELHIIIFFQFFSNDILHKLF